MSTELWSVVVALIALVGVLITAYLTHFIGVDFRRFRDGSTLAAALAGELSSHAAAIPDIRDSFNNLIAVFEQGGRFNFRPGEIPTDPIFLDSVPRLGLLGHKLVEDVVFTYQHIRSFRLTFRLLQENHSQMENDEITHRLRACLVTISRAEERSLTLLPMLKARADKAFMITFPWQFANRLSSFSTGLH